MITKALLFRYESQTDEDTMDTFLEDLATDVSWEKATQAWFGIRYMRGEFGMYSCFDDEAGREAHLNGKVAAALMEKARSGDLFARPPEIHRLGIMADKLPH